MYNVLQLLNNPHLSLKNIIHVTGTTGKTSVSKYLSSILLESSYSVNTYTAGNVYPNNNRINIKGEYISDNLLSSYIAEVQTIIKDHEVEYTYDQTLWLAALLAFKDDSAQFNIIETCEGNINDPTNIFANNQPIVNIVCPINADHVQINGNTPELNAIALSSTIYKNATLILGQQIKNVHLFFEELVKTQDCRFYRWDKDFWTETACFQTGLSFYTEWKSIFLEIPDSGIKYQAQNIALALMAIEDNINILPNVNNKTILKGVQNANIVGQMTKINLDKKDNRNSKFLLSEILIDFATNNVGGMTITNFIKNINIVGAHYRNAYIVMSLDTGYDNIGLIKALRPIAKEFIILENKKTPNPIQTENILKIGHITQIITTAKPNISNAFNYIINKDQTARIICVGCASMYEEIKQIYKIHN